MRNRRAIATPASCATNPKAALTAAPVSAVTTNKCLGLIISGRLKRALSKVPVTNPSCTESVSQFAPLSLKRHSVTNAGTTADPLNHKDMANSSAMASSASVRQRRGDLSRFWDVIGCDKASHSNAGREDSKSDLTRRPQCGAGQFPVAVALMCACAACLHTCCDPRAPSPLRWKHRPNRSARRRR